MLRCCLCIVCTISPQRRREEKEEKEGEGERNSGLILTASKSSVSRLICVYSSLVLR